MRGVGRSHAAVTVVNALPLGVGAAVGIAIDCVATVQTNPAPRPIRIEPATSVTSLVAEALRVASERYPMAEHVVRLDLSSDIPVAKGLKSSSAVATAIAAAVADAAGSAPSAIELARASAEAGRSSGTSATGAFDDALAGLAGGVVVTDNSSDRPLASFDVPHGLVAVVWLTHGTHAPAPSLLPAFVAERGAAQQAVDRVLAGRWEEALELNSEIVERVMGVDHSALRQECHRHGAVAAGVSGLGPAFAAIVPRPRARELVELFATQGGGTVVADVVRASLHLAPGAA
jgi:shikimate kinase